MKHAYSAYAEGWRPAPNGWSGRRWVADCGGSNNLVRGLKLVAVHWSSNIADRLHRADGPCSAGSITSFLPPLEEDSGQRLEQQAPEFLSAAFSMTERQRTAPASAARCRRAGSIVTATREGLFGVHHHGSELPDIDNFVCATDPAGNHLELHSDST